MRERNYGRIVMITSSTCVYGNFGQSNYGAAKMGLVGLAKTLSLEGARNDNRVSCLSPTAATRMTEAVMPQAVLDVLRPERVVPALLYLASSDAPNHAILCAGGGSVESAHVTLAQALAFGEAITPEDIRDHLSPRVGAPFRQGLRTDAGRASGGDAQAASPPPSLTGAAAVPPDDLLSYPPSSPKWRARMTAWGRRRTPSLS